MAFVYRGKLLGKTRVHLLCVVSELITSKRKRSATLMGLQQAVLTSPCNVQAGFGITSHGCGESEANWAVFSLRQSGMGERASCTLKSISLFCCGSPRKRSVLCTPAERQGSSLCLYPHSGTLQLSADAFVREE